MTTDSQHSSSGDFFVERPEGGLIARSALKPDAVGLVGSIMQNVTHIAPAIAAFANFHITQLILRRKSSAFFF